MAKQEKKPSTTVVRSAGDKQENATEEIINRVISVFSENGLSAEEGMGAIMTASLRLFVTIGNAATGDGEQVARDALQGMIEALDQKA